jgi:hypothetical protein
MPEATPAKPKEVAPAPVEEPVANNNFYNRLGILYCQKCGERRRTIEGTEPFCPISKPNCTGFSV